MTEYIENVMQGGAPTYQKWVLFKQPDVPPTKLSRNMLVVVHKNLSIYKVFSLYFYPESATMHSLKLKLKDVALSDIGEESTVPLGPMIN